MSTFDCLACYPRLCHCGGVEYRPKGGMCMTCTKKHEDCSGYSFFAMPVISTHDEGGNLVKIVRCSWHERESSK